MIFNAKKVKVNIKGRKSKLFAQEWKEDIVWDIKENGTEGK